MQGGQISSLEKQYNTCSQPISEITVGKKKFRASDPPWMSKSLELAYSYK